MHGYNIPRDTKLKKANILAICNKCGNMWKEEIEYCSILANSRRYDYCDKCLDKKVTNKEDIQKLRTEE